MAASDNTPVSKKMLAAEQRDQDRKTHPALILLAGFSTAVLLFFCCFCGIGMWWFRPHIYESPDRARSLTQEIVGIQIPDSYLPKGTIEWNLAFAMSVRGAYYERFVGDGLLTLVEVNSRFTADADVRRHIRQTLHEKGGGRTPLVMDDASLRRIEIEILGEPVPFNFEIGRDPLSGRTFHLVEGVFRGRQGEVLLAMRVHEDYWEETAIIEMLQSLKGIAP